MRLACGCDAEKCAHDPGVVINYCNDYIYIADRTGVLHRQLLRVSRNNITSANNVKGRKDFKSIHATLFRLLDTRFPQGWRQRECFIGASGVRVIYEPQPEGWDGKQEPYIAFGLDEEYNLSMNVCDKPARDWYGDSDAETETGNGTDPMDKFAYVPKRTFRRLI